MSEISIDNDSICGNTSLIDSTDTKQQYVYYYCYHYLITLEKNQDTILHSSVQPFDMHYALLSGNDLMVKCICHVKTGKTLNHIISGKTRYEVNQQGTYNCYLSQEAAFYNALHVKNYSGEWKSWYDNGSLHILGFYCHGKKHNEWKFYDMYCRLVKKGTYVNGTKHGKWVGYKDGQHISWIDDHTQDHIFHTKYLEGIEHIKEQRDVNGVLLSYCEWYYNTGEKHQVKVNMHFEGGKMHGMCVTWYENGILASIRNYKMGQLNGPLTEWNIDGTIIKRALYNMDQPVGRGLSCLTEIKLYHSTNNMIVV